MPGFFGKSVKWEEMLEHFNCRHEAKHNIGFCRSSLARSCWKSDIYAWDQVYFAINKYTSMVLCSLPSGFTSDTKTFHIAVFPKLATWRQHLMRCSVSPIIRTSVLDNARLDFYLQTKANSVAELPRWSHMRFCECQTPHALVVTPYRSMPLQLSKHWRSTLSETNNCPIQNIVVLSDKILPSAQSTCHNDNSN